MPRRISQGGPALVIASIVGGAVLFATVLYVSSNPAFVPLWNVGPVSYLIWSVVAAYLAVFGAVVYFGGRGRRRRHGR